ncbi:MAG: fumarylacetoacetate hydrolase family protein [Chloroflexi bacterium]|nr:fumarylacetoacetate hydrolase family protein [Chloroflexota bacterium]
MKIVRYAANGGARLGILEGDEVREAKGELFGQLTAGAKVGAVGDLQLLTPIVPGKILAIGLNYAAHAAESNQPLPKFPIVFMKPPSALIGPGATIVLPNATDRIDYEAELGVVIGKRCRHVKAGQENDVIFGYTCGNDVSDRDVQMGRSGQWVEGKAFDTFCPLGPAIATGIDAGNLAIKARLNGVTVQDSNTNDLIFDVPALIRHITGVMTLEPGDVIITGTPAGVGPLKAGDVIEIDIEGIGVLRNPVVLG